MVNERSKENDMELTIPCDSSLLEAVWEHAMENVDSHKMAYLSERKLLAYSAPNKSMLIYTFPKAIESSLPGGEYRLRLEKKNGKRMFFLDGFADPHMMNRIFNLFPTDDDPIKAKGINPSKLTKKQIYIGLNGMVKMRRLKPLHTKHFTSLYRTNGFYWFHGEELDLLLVR